MSIVAVHGPTMLGVVGIPAGANTNDLASLKADAVYGDAGTGAPNNGAGANDPAWTGAQKLALKDGTFAEWNGTAWVVYTP